MDLYGIYWALLLSIPAFGALGTIIRAAAGRGRKRARAKRGRDPMAMARALEPWREEQRQERARRMEQAQEPAPKRKRGRPRKEAAPDHSRGAEQVTAPEHSAGIIPAQGAARGLPETIRARYAGNNAFAGETVAFTGTLPEMKRADAMRAVEANGGRAYDTMPAGTTLLVVGDRPGACKMDKADKWGVKKIDAAEFWALIHQPLTLTPDEFAALLAA